jgi:hypothetical protein
LQNESMRITLYQLQSERKREEYGCIFLVGEPSAARETAGFLDEKEHLSIYEPARDCESVIQVVPRT